MPTNEQLYEWVKKYKGKHLSPLRSIKIYCKEQCCCGDTKSWKECTFTACILHRYRLGKGTRAKKNSLSKKQPSRQHFFSKKSDSDDTQRTLEVGK